MRSRLLFFVSATCLSLLAIIVSCRDQRVAPVRDSKDTTATVASHLPPGPQTLLDKWRNEIPDSLYVDSSKYVYGITKVNEKHFAFVAYTDSLLMIFQNADGSWVPVDTVVFKAFAHYITIDDLNNDGFHDLLIQCLCDAYANSYPAVFLYNAASSTLKNTPDYELNNIMFDKKLKLLRSARYSSIAHPMRKELYKPAGDGLLLVKGVEWLPPIDIGGPDTLNWYHMKNGEQIIDRSLTNRKGLLDRFARELWKD